MLQTSTNAIRSLLLLAFFAASVPAQAGAGRSAGSIFVTSHGKILRVHVAATVSLTEVLNALCREQKIQCAGTEYLAAFPVPSMTVDGTEEQVLSALLEGTAVNYTISRRDPGSVAQLTVLGRVAVVAEDVGEIVGRRKGQEESVSMQRSGLQHDLKDSDSVPKPESPEEQSRSEQVMQQMFIPSTSSPVLDGNQAQLVNGLDQPTSSHGDEYLPFPDQFGNPVRATFEAATVQPFPDHRGNPIPVSATPTQGSPFPSTAR